jgi:hypothetical protein
MELGAHNSSAGRLLVVSFERRWQVFGHLCRRVCEHMQCCLHHLTGHDLCGKVVREAWSTQSTSVALYVGDSRARNGEHTLYGKNKENQLSI